MTARTITTVIQEPLDDEERRLMERSTWDWDSSEDLHVVGRPGAVLRVRFTREEFLAIADLAQSKGVGPVELVRQTMLERIDVENADDHPTALTSNAAQAGGA